MSIKNEVLSTSGSESVSTLSQEETRKILTPFAFEIDKSLFGTPLASPTRRALAIAIDLLFVALLSDTPGEVLALVIAITLYRLGNKNRALKLGKQKGNKRRKLLRFLSFFIVFVVLLEFLPSLLSQSPFEPVRTQETTINSKANISESELSMAQVIAFSALSGGMLYTVSNSECIELVCWQNELSPLVKPFSSFELKDEVLKEAIGEIAAATELKKSPRAQLESYLIDVYQQALILKKQQEQEDDNTVELTEKSNKTNRLSSKILADNLLIDFEKPKEKRPVYSVMEWVKGIIEDLGLGFGWAAFYFTVFTSLWHGQTPGKKILGIRVLQLDGTPLSMWDSFGRYGGYGAGIATGLLGFMQIYWNANRQAIQDQISATVVIDDRQRQQELTKSK